ncbi:MAG: YkvA family protein [Cyanobacteria bacterium P01_C01_bin.120]
MKRLFGAPIARWFRRLLRNSKYRWLVILGSLVYLVSPLDIAPDVFPIIGWIDDGLLATLVATELTQIVLDRRRKGAQAAEQNPLSKHAETVIDVKSVTVG